MTRQEIDAFPVGGILVWNSGEPASAWYAYLRLTQRRWRRIASSSRWLAATSGVETTALHAGARWCHYLCDVPQAKAAVMEVLDDPERDS